MNYTFFTKNFTIPEGVKVISFDVFDTLLLRPFEKPTDLFTFLNPFVNNITKQKLNFKSLRKSAEKKAREKAGLNGEVTIDEIYDNLTEIPVKTRGAIKFLETESELKFCFARKSGEILYNLAKKQGVKIIATSDIYLEKQFIIKLLNKNNFYFDEVFCSSSYKKTKKMGLLYKEIIKEMEVLPSEILHIGDNEQSDIKKAKSIGIHTFHLPLLRGEFYKNSLYRRIFDYKKCLLTSVSIALMCEKLDTEKAKPEQDSLFSNNLYKIGFNAFGVILWAYTHWVLKMCRIYRVNKIFFASRDGFIMHKAFQILYGNQEIEAKYLECSRRSLTCLIINNKQDVVNVFTKRYRNTSIKEFILQKLECDPLKIASQIQDFGFKSIDESVKKIFPTAFTKQRLAKVVLFYAEEILHKMQNEKPNALLYLQKSGVLEEDIAICDVGYGGTIQKIISEVGDLKKCFGFYLITNHEAKNNEKMFGFLSESASRFKFKIVSSFVRLIESVIFSAPSGTVLNYNKDGEPVCEDLELIEQKRLEVNSFVWKGMVDFIISIKNHFGAEMNSLIYNKNSITKVFDSFAFTPTKKDAKMLEDIVFENKSNAGGYLKLIENNIWKLGSVAVKKPKTSKFLQFFIKIWLKYKVLSSK